MDDAIEHIWDEDDRMLTAEDLEDDCPCAGESRPLIEPGEYAAICFKTDITNYRGERKLLIQFRLCGGKHDGFELFLPCPYPKGARGYRTKYYQNWAIANGAPPENGQRMVRSVFTNRKFRILVGDSERRFEDRKLMPEFLQYSIVKSILGNIKDDDSH
ncbi:MAG: hypothetical protein CVT49_15760 [candidate division Zixibacteria bacterium HGW-Zixibacteria-1]|nr:MAG: hypothetical protein CVT49_15760 [candidate division Zixibacteria bacterium HGW-Zixibacteria-1]